MCSQQSLHIHDCWVTIQKNCFTYCRQIKYSGMKQRHSNLVPRIINTASAKVTSDTYLKNTVARASSVLSIRLRTTFIKYCLLWLIHNREISLILYDKAISFPVPRGNHIFPSQSNKFISTWKKKKKTTNKNNT